MFKNKGNYPYPILLESNIDYKTSKIKARYLYQSLKNGYNIRIECEINNEQIKNLIKDKKACYAVQIESSNAFYRKMFEFYDENDITIFLSNDEVVDIIEIGIAILAKEDIDNYQNDDFIDVYKEIKMKVNKNQLLGVCQSVKQPIVSNMEVLKEVSGIFKIQEDSSINKIIYDSSYDKIIITIPEDIGEYYKKCKGNKERIEILNTVIVIPIMTNIINDMKEDRCDDYFASKLWYKTLITKIQGLSEQTNKTVDELLDNSYETAQQIMQNMLIESIRTLKVLIDDEGSDMGQEGEDEE